MIALRLAAACSALFPALQLAAQCNNVVLPGGGLPGTSNQVSASTMWDPDGAGPAQARLVVGGGFGFHIAGGVVANGIAAWDPVTSTWTSFGTGMAAGIGAGSVHAVQGLPNGDLVATGDFLTAGGVAANRIARWNGTTWSPLGPGLSDFATCLATMPNGDLIVGGGFTQAGGATVNYIARWNGATWSPLGSGTQGPVNSLLVMPNGDLIAGGPFTAAGGVPANKVARWNGSTWSALGSGLGTAVSDGVRALALLPNGDIVAGGDFNFGAPASQIARWNGAVWSSLGTGVTGPYPSFVQALATLPNGDLVAGGGFSTAGGVPAARLARWNGVGWSALGGAFSAASNYAVWALTVAPGGDLFVGGNFESIGGVAVANLARWNGTAWSALDSGFGNSVMATLVMSNGDLVAGGSFVALGGTTMNHIGRWNGTAWSPLGSGLDGVVYALTLLPNGDLVAAGDFLNAGGVAASRIARWDGTAWSPLGGLGGVPFLTTVRALAALPNGDVVAGGSFTTAGGVPVKNIARWDGAAWWPLASGLDDPNSPRVEALAVMPNGDVVAGGTFLFSGSGGPQLNNIARWDGVAWSPLGTGMGTFGTVNALHVRANGDLIAGGWFSQAGGTMVNYIARWDGAVWSALGQGVQHRVFALASHANGDLFAGGYYPIPSVSVPIYRLARWDGTWWSAVGSGVDDTVQSLAALPSGDLALGGRFHLALGAVSPFFARVTTTCPATANSYGAGCASSAGPVALAATNLPWLGGTFGAAASGMPASSLAVAVWGLGQTNIALPSILPQGVAGCSLLATPDLLGVLLPVAGTAQSQLMLPNSLSLANQVVHHQVAALELGAGGNIVAVTSSNALTLTLGSF